MLDERLTGKLQTDPLEEMGALGLRRDFHSLERTGKSHVHVKVVVIRVKMKERAGLTRKGTSLALAQARDQTQRDEKVLHLIEVLIGCVPHGVSLTWDSIGRKGCGWRRARVVRDVSPVIRLGVAISVA
jgi:hypothetical protein